MLAFLASLDVPIKIVTVAFVCMGLFYNWRAHAERTTFEIIDRSYALGNAWLAQVLKDWRLAHLLECSAEKYEATRKLCEAGLTPEQRDEYRAMERVLAIQIFVAFEQIYFHWELSQGKSYPRRLAFLADMLEYFTAGVLMNPRLAGFLQMETNPVKLHLGQRAWDYLGKHYNPPQFVDCRGPFAEPAPEVTP